MPGDNTADGVRPHEIELAVVVKAYPAISAKNGEVVCLARIRTDLAAPEWVRLWPMKIRDADPSLQFKKWDLIRGTAAASGADKRPESMAPMLTTFRRTGTLASAHGWRDRRVLSDPLLRTFPQHLADHALRKTSLANIVAGEALDLEFEKKPAALLLKQTTAAFEAAGGDMQSLFGDTQRPLEPIPVIGRLVMRFDGETEPRKLAIEDWEFWQTWRRWGRTYPSGFEDRLRQKWLGEMLAPTKDASVVIGNQFHAREQWALLSVLWPPAASDVDQGQLDLFG